MSDKLTEGLRFLNTEQGVTEMPREQTKAHAYNPHEKASARRKLTGVAKAIAALTFMGGAYMAASDSDYKQEVQTQAHASQELQQVKENIYKPDSFFNGNVKIEINNSLNVRKAPSRDNNTVEWSEIKELQGVSIQGFESLMVENPFITTRGANVDGQAGNGAWMVFDAIIDNGFGPTKEKLFIALAKQTGAFVQVQDSGGTIKPLSDSLENDNLGVITVSP